MSIKTGLIGLIVVAATGVASTAEAAAKATPEEIAAASARADALITASGAPTEFINGTATGTPVVVHRASGLRCPFWSEEGVRLELVPATAGHGVGVRCASVWDGELVTVEVVRATSKVEIGALAGEALAAEQGQHPDLKVLTDGPPPKGRAPAPWKFVSFNYGGEAPAGYVHLSTGIVGDWLVSSRLDGSYARPGFKADTADFKATLMAVMTLDDLKAASVRR